MTKKQQFVSKKAADLRTGLAAAKALQKAGFKAYFVGGIARDMIAGTQFAADVDIATSAQPAEIKDILGKAGMELDLKGQRFGSIAAKKVGAAEITTFRREGRYSDSRHPDTVLFVSDLREDAIRRDFTINAIYYDPVKKIVEDPVGGRKDLNAKLIRLIGDPKKRIDEDHLRMLRAVRLAVQLDFKLEKNTYAAIKTRAKLIGSVAGTRIKTELDKILLSQQPDRGIKLLDEIGLLRFVLPELTALKNVSHRSKRYHLEGDVLTHSLMALSEIKNPQLEVRYAALLHDIGKASTGKKVKTEDGWVVRFYGHDQESVRLFKGIAKHLNFPKKQAKKISWLILNNRHWPDFERLSLTQKLALVSHPDTGNLLELWQADANSNLNLHPDGSLVPYKTNAIKTASRLAKTYAEKRNELDKLWKDKFFLAKTKQLRGDELKCAIESATEAVMKNKITFGKTRND